MGCGDRQTTELSTIFKCLESEVELVVDYPARIQDLSQDFSGWSKTSETMSPWLGWFQPREVCVRHVHPGCVLSSNYWRGARWLGTRGAARRVQQQQLRKAGVENGANVAPHYNVRAVRANVPRPPNPLSVHTADTGHSPARLSLASSLSMKCRQPHSQFALKRRSSRRRKTDIRKRCATAADPRCCLLTNTPNGTP